MLQWWTVPGEAGGVLEPRQVARPEPGPGQVLVKVHGAGVNRGELIGKALLRKDNPSASARTSGIECAGVVIALGSDTSGYGGGDKIMARGTACHAEYVVIDAAALMPVPAHLSLVEAAAIPNVFVTAHDAIVTNAGLKPGEKILVTAGSSGVGSAAIQIARFLGAGSVVATTRNPDKVNHLKEIGADHVIDTTSEQWSEEVIELSGGGVDIVIDQVGGAIFDQLVRSMAVKARYVSVGRNAGATAALDLDLLALKRLNLIGVTFRTRNQEEALACSQQFARDLLPAFDSGELKPVLDRSFALNQLPAAHDYMKSDEQFGKIVLTHD